jgi:hypothetical protein
MKPSPLRGKTGATVDGRGRDLTEGERQNLDRQLSGIDARISAQLSGDGLKKQLVDTMKQLDEAKIVRESGDAVKWVDSPEFRKQMKEMQRQVAAATAKIESPELRKQLEMASKISSDVTLNLKMQLARNVTDNVDLNMQMKDLDLEIAALPSRLAVLNDPKLKLSIEEARRKAAAAAAQFDTPEFKKQMEEMEKRMQSGDMQKSMDAAERDMREAADTLKRLKEK